MAKGRRSIHLPEKVAGVIDRDEGQSTSARVVGIVYAFSAFVAENLVDRFTPDDYRDLIATWKNTPSEYSNHPLFAGLTTSQRLATGEVVVCLVGTQALTDKAINAVLTELKAALDVKEVMREVHKININGNI